MDTAPLPYTGVDFYGLDDLLTDQEKEVRQRVWAVLRERVVPVINDYWERAAFPFDLIPVLADLRVAGGSIQGYGCPGLSSVGAGLVGQEMARADGSISTFFGVQSGLVIPSIYYCGSEEQRQRWIPPLASLESIGAFALTEPEVGSDASHLQTRASRQGDAWVLNGSKRWIGNASIADLTVVWARDDDGHVGGFVVERGTPGFVATRIEGKASKRAVWQADVTLTDCAIPADHRLANARTFRDTATVLMHARSGVAWGALGHAMACYDAALVYARDRRQFGKPIGGYQLVQEKLVRMLAEITASQLLCWRLGHLRDAGKLTHAIASLAKLNNAAKAREIAAMARDILGGNGILLANHVARHQADMEAVYTYEGTDTVQALIVGREITGVQAFS